MITKLIGFAGKKFSGKSTAANWFIQNENAICIPVAQPLKDGLQVMFGWTSEQLADPELKEVVDPFLGFSPRRAMQLIGTEGVRKLLGEDTWAKMLMKTINNIWSFQPDQVIVVPDIRFEDEAAAIRDAGGVIVHVIRHVVNHIVDGHSSEAGIQTKAGDWLIHNDRSLEDFEEVLKNLAETVDTRV